MIPDCPSHEVRPAVTVYADGRDPTPARGYCPWCGADRFGEPERPRKTHTCPGCGERFAPASLPARYCSQGCALGAQTASRFGSAARRSA